jgi:uncharacterized protein YycO
MKNQTIMNKILKQTFILLTFYLIVISCNSNNNFQIEEGDLLFQNTGTGETATAIKDVSATSFSKNYSHIGMAMQEDDQWFVLEAIPKKGICKTPLIAFLNRNKNEFNKSKTTVARLERYYQAYISEAIAYGMARINTPYDEIFLWDDDSYYCSELVYKMFSSQDLPKESIPFLTHPMTFKDSTGNLMPSWDRYYETRNQPIPEGIEGTNPNLMASSPHLKFVHDYENE